MSGYGSYYYALKYNKIVDLWCYSVEYFRKKSYQVELQRKSFCPIKLSYQEIISSTQPNIIFDGKMNNTLMLITKIS